VELLLLRVVETAGLGMAGEGYRWVDGKSHSELVPVCKHV
jgi:hypothetical protein